VVERNEVVPMMADWTDKNQEIKDALLGLGSRSIPLLAIYPADRPGEVIVLRDVVSEKQVLQALSQAGATRGIRSDGFRPDPKLQAKTLASRPPKNEAGTCGEGAGGGQSELTRYPCCFSTRPI